MLSGSLSGGEQKCCFDRISGVHGKAVTLLIFSSARFGLTAGHVGWNREVGDGCYFAARCGFAPSNGIFP